MISYEILNNLSKTFGESFYILDTQKFEKNYDEFIEAFRNIYPKSFIAYSYKTNYLPKLCLLVDRKGGYAEVASEMELDLALKLNVSPKKIIYNGPYKSEGSIKKCLLGGGIVNLDSFTEVEMIEKIAKENPKKKICIGIRCNFDIGDSKISRFGFDIEKDDVGFVLKKLSIIKNVKIGGLHCHFPTRSLETFARRIDKMIELAKEFFIFPPNFIDIGGGFFSKMDNSLKKQFQCRVPTFQEYAEVIATKMQQVYGNLDKSTRPKLFLEPGSALVADTMKFVAKVISIKFVRDKCIATVSGSRFNIIPTSEKINLPIKVYHHYKNNEEKKRFQIDIAGYTCIENDYLYRGYQGCLAVGDYIVFDNVGSYSIVLKPPFILPNCPIIEYDSKKQKYLLVKRGETFNDIFAIFLK